MQIRPTILSLIGLFCILDSYSYSESSFKKWKISDSDFCLKSSKPENGAIYRTYRAISRSVPHSDSFYPSCSRFIKTSLERKSILGLIMGLGRFSRAHLPYVHPDFRSVTINKEVRIYDPIKEPDHQNLQNNGFTAMPTFYTDCDETQRVQPSYSHDNGPNPAWRL